MVSSGTQVASQAGWAPTWNITGEARWGAGRGLHAAALPTQLVARRRCRAALRRGAAAASPLGGIREVVQRTPCRLPAHLVGVVVAGPRLVAHPDAKVLHSGGVALKDLQAGGDAEGAMGLEGATGGRRRGGNRAGAASVAAAGSGMMAGREGCHGCMPTLCAACRYHTVTDAGLMPQRSAAQHSCFAALLRSRLRGLQAYSNSGCMLLMLAVASMSRRAARLRCAADATSPRQHALTCRRWLQLPVLPHSAAQHHDEQHCLPAKLCRLLRPRRSPTPLQLFTSSCCCCCCCSYLVAGNDLAVGLLHLPQLAQEVPAGQQRRGTKARVTSRTGHAHLYTRCRQKVAAANDMLWPCGGAMPTRCCCCVESCRRGAVAEPPRLLRCMPGSTACMLSCTSSDQRLALLQAAPSAHRAQPGCAGALHEPAPC